MDFIDFEEDKKEYEQIVKLFEKETGEKVYFRCTSNEGEFASMLTSNSIGIIDYGALNFSGQSGLKDHYDRFMEKIISEHSSINFIFHLTMGKEYYADELFDHSNVITFDRNSGHNGWVLLLKNYI